MLYLFVPRDRTGSGSCGTTWYAVPSARWSWSTPDGWEDCFRPVDFFEARKPALRLAINAFDGMLRHSPEDVREALQLSQQVP